MKRFILTALMILATNSVYAQISTTTAELGEVTGPDQIVGLRAGLTYTNLDFLVRSNNGRTTEGNLGRGPGVKVGIENLPVKDFGFISDLGITRLTYDETSVVTGNQDVYLVRVEGNLAYATSSRLFYKAGLNLSNIEGDKDINFDPAFGGQLGVGYQVIKNLSVEASYVSTNQEYSFLGSTREITERGFEIGVTGTF